MYFYLCLCGALLIASVQSRNLTMPERNHTQKISSDGSKTDLLIKPNLTLVSEGGMLLPTKSDLSLPKEKLNSLITLDEELSKTKEKAVVPRKGVHMEVDEKTSQPKSKKVSNLMPATNNVTNTLKAVNGSTNVLVKSDLTNNSSNIPKLNSTKVPKKPLVTSYEALTNMEKQIQSEQPKIQVMPSSKSIASSQIPSPNQDSIKKVYSSKGNSHPEMIMPIVITILVVPMFAIVGYFALKRGQEAWKNRHYKRMDFLLDGMYND